MSFDPMRRLIGLQRGYLFAWVPVCLGVGIGLFFRIAEEPGGGFYVVLVAVSLLAGIVAVRCAETAQPLAMALALVAGGVVLAGIRTHLVAAPVIDFRYYGPIEGRVVAVDRSLSDKQRVTLDRVVLKRTALDRTPHRVRVSMHGDQVFTDPVPGQRVAVTGHLSGPSGPVEPHGFNFQRMAWFDRLGAVGYARAPLVLIAPPARYEPMAALGRLRLRLSAAVQAAMPGQAGAFAAAVTTGDRSGLTRETLDAMRDSNLAHLLAISGLHVGLLTAFIFATLRAGLALMPRIALRVPSKKLAAAVALCASAGYLALSGGSVSTQRAFVMAAVMLVAVMLDRRALTLRSVALAAIIILVWQPEAILSPGFQMSFAATAALVWVFEMLGGSTRRAPKWARGVLALVISSGVAGLATAPYAAAHFNQAAHYGLVANLLSVPVMGSIVIPAAVLAACLSPLGLGWIGLWGMGLGTTWILAVAEKVAGFEGAVRFIAQPGPMVMPVLTFGALIVMLVQGWARWVGCVPAVVAGVLWMGSDRPDLLIAENGALVGVMTPDGRALTRARGHGFVARSWLENDGRDRDRLVAAERAEAFRDGDHLRFTVAGADIGVLFSANEDELAAACRTFAVVVSNRAAPDPPGTGCILLTPETLAETGAISVSGSATAPRLVFGDQADGTRMWNDKATRQSTLSLMHLWQLPKENTPETQLADALRLRWGAPAPVAAPSFRIGALKSNQ